MVKVGVETDEGEEVALGDDVLVGVIEVEPLRLHGGCVGPQVSRRNGAERHLATDEEVVDELVEFGGVFLPAKDDTNGVE